MERREIDASWNGSGLILFRASEQELEAYREKNIAVVLTSTEGPDLGYPRVVTDNEQIGIQAADHLIRAMFSNFAFIGRSEALHKHEQFAPGIRKYARERLAAFKQHLAEFHIEPTVHYLEGRPLWKEDTWTSVQREIGQFLSELPTPCGIFAADDSLAIVTMKAAESVGLKVPSDIAIIGFGDDPGQCFSTFPSLTSMPYPGREVGQAAAHLLERQLSGENLDHYCQCVPVGQVVARESTQTLAIDDPRVCKAIDFIRTNAKKDAVQVSELIEFSGLSATTLKSRFAKYLGHSPKQEIKQVRLQHLLYLLAKNLPLETISKEMNFSTVHELSRFLHRETGQRPSDVRSSK